MNDTPRPAPYEWPLPARSPDPFDRLMAEAFEAGGSARPGWTHRRDGWTPRRICIFLQALSQSGVVAEAARAAGMSVRSAYALRDKARGQAFDRAWQAAVATARQRRAERAMSRTRARSLVPIIRDGKLWGIRHRPDNRFDMATLTRLDRWEASLGEDEQELLHQLAGDFDALIEIACAHGEPASCSTRPDDCSPQAPSDRDPRQAVNFVNFIGGEAD